MANTDADVIATMAAHGGSFVKALAECARRADPHNLSRLKGAFPDLWAHYGNVAGRDRELSPGESATAVGDAFDRVLKRWEDER